MPETDVAFGLSLHAMQSILLRLAAAGRLAEAAKAAIPALSELGDVQAVDKLLRALADWDEASQQWGKR